MSRTQLTSTSSNFQLIFDNTLKVYKKRTKNDLLTHPLADRLKDCKSAGSILTVLQEQVQELNQSQRSNTKWLDPTVNVLHAFSETLGEGVGSAFPPAKVIFIGFAVLISTAKNVRADQDTLFEMFERIEAFFRRLDKYTKVAPDQGMMDTIMAIMVEVLNILAIATKEVRKGRIKKYLKKLTKKLIENNDMKHALKKLDWLTQEEARMASEQLELLEITHTVNSEVMEIVHNVIVIDDRVAGVDDRVAGVGGRVAGVDERVAGVDDRVAGVDDRVAGVGGRVAGVDERVASVDDRVTVVYRVKDVDEQVKAVDDKLVAVIDDGKEAREVIQRTAVDVDRVKQKQIQQDLRRWLSPPDPSKNHNIACDAYQKTTATWFFEGRIYNEWKSTDSDSLLWIHGKPGSGKTILCSTIIQDIETICDTGLASMAYFYFDFRDVNKQRRRDLISSFLIQLSSRSDLCCDTLSRLYSDHDNGAQQPSDGTLGDCLIEMLTVQGQGPIYLIMDALDECPNNELPSPRDRVLWFLKELIDLHLPNVCICVTSRPEFDIRDVCEPLTSRRVSLHDQSGQKKDIEDYVRSVVYSDPVMRRWRNKDKELVIETLSERADGMFRWTFCQLEVLRHCLAPRIRQTLDELPESLDETYERILKEIEKPIREFARRVLQCMVVATRPLRVAELAEVLAVDLNDAEGIPRLNPDWRLPVEDQERVLLHSCSSLIAIVEAGHSDSEAETDDGDSHIKAGGSRIVQFSHFSVKEFLTSSRLADAYYYIDLEPAHTILAQACLGGLLQIQDDIEECTPEDHPLARYAAEHWTTHALFGKVSSRLHKGMEYLFDENEPHFKVWLTLCDIETWPNDDATFYGFATSRKSPAGPLYYAALCGFHDLVEHLITEHPQDVNADGGYYKRPLVAALAGGHFRTADLLRNNGADLHVWGYSGISPLHAAAYSGNFEVVRILIEYDLADINARDEGGWTPLLWASGGQQFKDGSVVRLLLEHGADINMRDGDGWTPLHCASFNGALEVVRLLLEQSADVEVKDNDGKTALQVAADRGHDKVVELLREYGV